MDKFASVAMVLMLIMISILPGACPGSIQSASAYAPPPPAEPAPTSAPAEGRPDGSESHPVPSPGTLPPEVEEARAREAIETVLDKYLRYWGPRYQVAPVEVTVEDEWAHAVVAWQSQAQTLSGPIQVLAHRSENGNWQALMPSSEGLYLQWVDKLSETLTPSDIKALLRSQAISADALQKSLAEAGVSPAATLLPQGTSSSTPSEAIGPNSMQCTPTPTAGPPTKTQPEDSSPRERLQPLAFPTAAAGCGTGTAEGARPTLDQSDESAVRQAMLALPVLQTKDASTGYHYKISAIWGSSDWAVGELALVDEQSAMVPSGGDIVLAWRTANGAWLAGEKGTEDFNHVLNMIPDTSFVPSTKEMLYIADGSVGIMADSSGIYKLPYTCNASAYVSHVHNDDGQVYDIDFGISGQDIVAARDGWISQIVESYNACCYSSVCAPCNNYVVINHGDGEYSYYLHIKQWSVPDYLGMGTFVHQGDKIAEQGDVGWTGGNSRDDVPCNGSTIDSKCGIHLHFGVHKGPYWNSTTVRPRFQDVYDSHGTWYVASGQTYVSGNCGGSDTTDPDGDITSPSEGATISSRSVHLAGWGSDSQSGFNHAHFTAYYSGSWRQVGPDFTSSPFGFDWDMCDASVPDGSVTIGLDIWDNAGNEANSPHGVRHFTKNYNCSPPPSCNPNSDQVALYDDPNRNNNGSCVTLNVGNYPNPGTLGSLGNDVASSVKVGSNVQAILCRHDNYQDCETFTSDDGNLADNFVGDNAVSSAKVEWRASPPPAPVLQSPSNGARLPQSTNLTFYWNSSPGATGYRAHYEGGPSGAHDSPLLSSTSWNVGTQWCGDYSWRVQAVNNAGDSPWSSTWTFTIVPNTPTGLIASAASSSQINLSWNDPGGEKDGYRVYYSNGSYIGSTSSTSYQVTGLSCGTSYSFYVKAYRNSYLSDASNTASASTQSCPPADTQPPEINWVAPVGNTEVFVCRDTVVQLEAHATDNVAVERVRFYRWDAINEQWLEIGTDYSAPYQVSLDCSILNLGWNQVNTRAYDTSGNGSSSKYIWIDRPTPAPDLHPFAPDGYPLPVVPASIPGSHQVDTLIAGQPTYFDWYFANTGNATASGDFHVELWVGGTRHIRYPFSNWGSGWASGFDDWNITIPTSGWQTVRLTTDPDDTISEYDESNNTWQQQFYWAPRAPYADSVEAGTNDWTATGLWHQVDDASNSYGESHSWSHSWWYGQDATGNYDTGGSNAGDLTSPPIYIPSTGHYLRFWYRYETETMANDWDVRSVQIAVDGGQFSEVLQLWDDPMNFWLRSPALDLSGYAGHVIQVRFHFDTRDAYFNNFRGWYIDDLEISTTLPPSCADAYEPNDLANQAKAISYGQTLSADICPGGDYDFYTFTGTAGDKVVVDIDAKLNDSLLDSYVFLLDSDGTTVLAEHDDEIAVEVQDSLLGYHLPHDGTYYVKVRAWNHPSVGSTDHYYDIHLLTDESNPSSTEVTSPISSAWLDSSQQNVAVSAADNESGVNRVEFLWHDADWENSDWVWLGADRDGRDGWTWDMDTSGLSEQRGGAFYVWAFDWVGNWTGAGAWNLGIDRTAPYASASTWSMYGDAPFRDFYVFYSGDDNLSGVDDYDVQVREDAGMWTDLLINATATYTRFVGLDGHTYYFRARARDYAGNEGVYADGDGDTRHAVEICPIAADDYEPDNDTATARSIVLDGTWNTHNVHAEGDQDWVQFHAATGITYTLKTTTTGEHADTVLFLYEPDGTTLIASDDDGGADHASYLEWQPITSGTYYAMVNHWDPWAYGCTTGYELSISTDDETAPTGSVRIDAGATYANSRAVELNLTATDAGTGVAQAMAANSSDFAGAAWVDYAASLAWTLPPGDDTKTVYLKLRDWAGNESEPYSDSIVLDTTAPTGSILIEVGAEVVTDTEVVLSLAANDANGVVQMRLRNNVEAWGEWESLLKSRSWTLPEAEGEHTIWVQFRDVAGNLSAPYADTVLLDLPAYYLHLPLVVRNR